MDTDDVIIPNPHSASGGRGEQNSPVRSSAGMNSARSSSYSHKRSRRVQERLIETLLFLAALSSVMTTFAIAAILVYESIPFFQHVSLREFLTDTQWTPLFDNAHYGIMPLVAGTMVTTGVALLVSIPMGTIIAIYLSEFAPHKVREVGLGVLEVGGRGVLGRLGGEEHLR